MMSEPEVHATPVTAETWALFDSYFQARGGPGYCWCMAFRAIAPGADNAARRAAMAARVADGVPVGLILSGADGALGWCSIAPRDTYRGLGGPDAAPGERIWSLACLHLRRPARQQGHVRRMIAAAEDYARREGATVIEATPVAADSPSYGFMGRVSTFRSLGYAEVARAGTRRHVMRKVLA